MKYQGGKNGSGVFQRLICMMPPHEIYIEAFLGSGAIMRRKRPAAKSYAYELNPATIKEFAEHLPADRFEAWSINSDWNYPGPLPGNGGTSIGFNHPGTDSIALEVFNVDAFDALQKFVASSYFWGYNDPGDVLLYVDPPYPNSVRSSPGKIYQFELMAETEHADLLDLLLRIPCKIMLSGYENELYNSKLKGWRKETIATTNRAGSRVIETVWLNFPEPIELHDYSHVGNDYRDRWRMTKRLNNWTGQLKAMRPAERGAMLEQLSAAMAEFNAAGKLADAKAAAAIARKAANYEKRTTVTPKTALPDPEPPELFGPDSFGGEDFPNYPIGGEK